MSRKKAKAPLGAAGLIAGIVAIAVVMAPGTLSNFVSSTQTQAASVSTGDAGLVKELQDFVKQRIAPYKYPRVIEFLEALPKTATGKLSRKSLRN